MVPRVLISDRFVTSSMRIDSLLVYPEFRSTERMKVRA